MQLAFDEEELRAGEGAGLEAEIFWFLLEKGLFPQRSVEFLELVGVDGLVLQRVSDLFKYNILLWPD